MEDRRAYRTNRRRLERRRQRIAWLQDLFCDEINKVDTNFLRRLTENDLQLQDRSQNVGKYSLFNDKKYTDADYYRDYPTIYHLRKELMERPAKDIRLLYLAIHNIIKKRGNFLIGGDIKEEKDIIGLIETLNVAINEYNNEQDMIGRDSHIDSFLLPECEKDITDIIENNTISKKQKQKELFSQLGAKTSIQKTLIGTIMNNVINLVTIFGKDKYSEESFGTAKFYFSDEKAEEILMALDGELSTEEYNIIMCLKRIYDWNMLTKTLKGYNTVSDAMIDTYNNHKQDLSDLKYLIKKYNESEYEHIFGEPEVKKNKLNLNDINYTMYVGGGYYDGHKLGSTGHELEYSSNGRLGHTCTQDEFCKMISKVLADIEYGEEDIELYNTIKMKIDNGIFLPKITSKNNTVIPHQFNENELKRIIEVSSTQYPFLLREEDGLTVKDKIIKIFEFKRPYYVGPLGTSDKKNVWCIRKEEGLITPWNFDTKIDRPATNEEFIKRMTVRCTYLKGEKTLPKKSIIMSAFVALNELNKIKVNGEFMSVELKQKLFREIYLKKKPTLKNISTFIKNNTGVDEVVLSNVDKDLQGDMKTYIDLYKILGDRVDKYPDIIEDIIFILTISADDSSMIEAVLKEKYGMNSKNNLLTDAEIKRLKGFRYNGWSNLSCGLLLGSTRGKNGIMLENKGNRYDILEIMWNTNLNFMEIINSDEYDFAKAVHEYELSHGIEYSNEITYEDIDELYCSPSVKRGLWQAVQMTKELVKYFGEPDKVFIESTRTNDDKKKDRTKSRQENLLDLYKNSASHDKATYTKFFEDFDECRANILNYDNDRLRQEKLYLYFLQLGKDLYTGKKIDLDELLNDKSNAYDIDHIIPQSLVKDDSINNKVLTTSIINQKVKEHYYPITGKISSLRQESLWKSLNKLGLISNEKYNRLMRISPITEEDRAGFINRQLVETNQTVKCFKDLLLRYFKSDVEIVMSKANNVSAFRKNYHLTKSRDVNDFHHACDAYLNIVVGNVLNEEYNHNIKYDREHNNDVDKSLNFERAFLRPVYSFREKRNIWEPVILNNRPNPNSSMIVVEKELDKRDFSMSKKTIENKGQLYEQTIAKAKMCSELNYPKKSTNALVDTSRYGGYSSSGTAYFIVVDSIKKGKAIRTIEAMPIYYKEQIASGHMTMESFLSDVCQLKDATLADIIGTKNSKILKGTLVEIKCDNNVRCRLRIIGTTHHGKTILFNNANQLFLSNEQTEYIKEIAIVLDKIKKLALEQKLKIDNEVGYELYCTIENDKIRRGKNPNHNNHIININKKDNEKLYKCLLNKLTDKYSPYTYINSYASIKDTLQQGYNSYLEMNEYNQIVLLRQLLKIFQCKGGTVDLSCLTWFDDKNTLKKGSANLGNIGISNNITDYSGKIDIVFQSITGLKEKHIPMV